VGRYEGWLIVSDMDGTLLDDDKKISEENQQSINYFIENGGIFTIATGRMTSAVRMYLDKININAPAILHNGAQIYDFKKNQEVFSKYIEEDRKECIRRVYKDIPEPGIEVFTGNDHVYVYRECSETKRYDDREVNIKYCMPDYAWNEKWIKVLIIGDKELLDRIEPVYKTIYDKGYSVRSGDMYLDIVANGVSKGLALKELVKCLGIRRDHVIAAGDNMNDISMLYAAGYGVAPGNAEQEVKEAADLVAPDNNHPIVKFIIEEIIDKNIKKISLTN
jgi:Cof subfamily protein (haloacid dehalogenase superfamily)